MPYSQIALCGPHASVFPGGILSKYNFINYILIGEYEFILLELVKLLEINSTFESLKGLAYRRDQEIKINVLRPTVDNLNKVGFILLQIPDVDSALVAFKKSKNEEMTSFIKSNF